MKQPPRANTPLGNTTEVARYFFIMTYVSAKVVTALDAVHGMEDRPEDQDLRLATPDARSAPPMVSPLIKLGLEPLKTYPTTPSAATNRPHGNVRQKSCLGTHAFMSSRRIFVTSCELLATRMFLW